MMSVRVLMLGTDLSMKGGIATVVAVWRGSGLFESESVRYLATHCDGSLFRRLRKAVLALIRFMFEIAVRPPVIIHVHLASRGSFWRKLFFLRLSAWRGVPYIVHLHGAEFQVFHDQESGAWARLQIRKVFVDATRVLVLSRSWLQWVQASFPGVRAQIMFNAVAPCPPMDAARFQRDTVLFLGRLGERKGVVDLLSAFARIAGGYPDVRLVLAGDGDVQGTRARVHQLGLDERVVVPGWVVGDQKAELLGRALCYVLPSYNEGLPMSVLEAMAAGLPVLTTPVGGIPDAVTDGVEGFLVEAGDVSALTQRLDELLGDGALRQRMSAAGIARIERDFSARSAVRQLSAIYREIEQGRA